MIDANIWMSQVADRAGGHFEGAINLDAAWIGNSKMDAMLTDNGM